MKNIFDYRWVRNLYLLLGSIILIVNLYLMLTEGINKKIFIGSLEVLCWMTFAAINNKYKIIKTILLIFAIIFLISLYIL